MSIIQIALLGIAGTLFVIQLKQNKAEYAILLCVGISILVFFSILGQLRMIIRTIKEVMSLVDLDTTYLATLFKMLGVTYVAEFSSGICKDAGCQSIATQIEIFSKLTILVLSLPILVALLKTIQSFLV